MPAPTARDEKNKMLIRIYGTAFTKKEELEQYLERIEEAKRRDHRKLGRELGIFTMMEEGPAFRSFFPKGMILKNTLIDYWREFIPGGLSGNQHADDVESDALGNLRHWDHYKDNIYTTTIDEETFCVKPMNCPGGMLVYKMEPRSYRDLPMRIGELGLVHRHEKSGALHGLMRVRCFTQDDAHIYMTEDQISDEIKGVVRLIDEVYALFGFNIMWSFRPCRRIISVLLRMGARHKTACAMHWMSSACRMSSTKGTARFMGRRSISILRILSGAHGSAEPFSSIFSFRCAFDAEYTAADGQKRRSDYDTPGRIWLYRAIYRHSYRALCREISDVACARSGEGYHHYGPRERLCGRNYGALKDRGLRVELDCRSESANYKIRAAQLEKIPYMLVIGDREVEKRASFRSDARRKGAWRYDAGCVRGDGGGGNPHEKKLNGSPRQAL